MNPDGNFVRMLNDLEQDCLEDMQVLNNLSHQQGSSMMESVYYAQQSLENGRQQFYGTETFYQQQDIPTATQIQNNIRRNQSKNIKYLQIWTTGALGRPLSMRLRSITARLLTR